MARLRGVGFTLWDRTLAALPPRHGYSQRKTEDWDKGGGGEGSGGQVWSASQAWHIPEGKKWGCVAWSPPLTEPGTGQSISKLIRRIWSTKGPTPLMLTKSAKATASAATDWPDLSYSIALLSGPEVLKRFLLGWSHHPPPHARWDLGRPEHQAQLLQYS